MHQELSLRIQSDVSLENWREKEKKALELLRIAGELRFDRSIELIIFRNDVYDARPSEVLNDHRYSRDYFNQSITIEHTLAIARAIVDWKELSPSKIDLGKLAVEWMEEKGAFSTIDAFIRTKLGAHQEVNANKLEPKDVVLYGFGRIGRLAARRLIAQTGKGEQLRLRAIVIRQKMKTIAEELQKRAGLLREDSVHGSFPGSIQIDQEHQQLIINGNRIQMIFAGHPSDIDYTQYGIKDALVIDNTGVWRDKEALSIHLRPGISQVMLTAPAKGVPNIVHGVNQHMLKADESIFCAASCTTNAIAPILKVVQETYGIEKGHVETIHAYTNDQNLLDNFHKKPRRGKAAPLNMVLTTTGAAKAVSKALPSLEGKLTGNSVRVPTPNVSLAIMSLSLEKPTTVEEVNKTIRDAAYHGSLMEQIHYSSSEEYASSNAVGMTTTSVLDSPSTIVSGDGKSITLYAWYDNEYGYTCQVIRLAKHAARVRRFVYY
jgi:glyceraldehyde 3-phosphate dehydrogenase